MVKTVERYACAAKGLGHIWLDWNFDPEHIKLHEYCLQR